MKINFNYLTWALLLVLPACGGRGIVLTRSRLLMGHVPVQVEIRTAEARKAQALEASEAAYREAVRLEKLWSEYREDSEISCLNRRAGRGPCRLSPETLQLLEQARRFSKQSRRAFDVRFLSKTKAGREGEIVIRPDRGEAALAHPETRLGLGGIAKGAIVEAMSRTLTGRGFPDHLISAGGDLVARGGPWEVAIQVPGAPPGAFVRKQSLTDRAVATSGSYEQGGHILDPRTGRRRQRRGAVTVFAGDLTTADALATACFVLGEEATPGLLEKFPGVEALWVNP